jgi:SulP family sulfate permease
MRGHGGWAADFFPNLLAGLTSGLVNVAYSVSFAALIFSGHLAPYFPQGLGTVLMGAAVTGIIVAWRSPFPFTLAGPEANSAIILALAGRSIAEALGSPAQQSSIYPTVWASIILSSATIGLFLYLLGRFHLGQLVRYVPYPVIGGFLAGTGWLITRSSFKVMTGIPLGLAELPNFLRADILDQWIAGVAVASILFLVLNRFRHFLILPGVLLGGVVLGKAVWWILQRASPPLNPDGWFFKPFPHDGVWAGWTFATLTHIDWAVLGHQAGTLLAMMVIVMLSILLNSTGLEVATGRNIDLNDELRANGVANLVNGACGGVVGYLSINRCLLNHQAGATSPVAGTIAGLVCGSVLVFGSSFLTYVPKPLMGGLLLYIGGNLLVRWVFKSRSQLPFFDYLLVLLILTIIVSFGFLAGVGVGILIACLLFIVSYGKTSCIKYTLSGETCQSNVFRSDAQQELLRKEGDSIAIFVLHGFIFFGTANSLLDQVRRRLGDETRAKLAYMVLDFRLVSGLDSSATLSFVKLEQLATKVALNLVFTQLHPLIEAQLRQGGVGSGKGAGFRSYTDLDHGVEWCENQILESHQMLAAPTLPLAAQLLSLLKETGKVATLMSYLRPIELQAGQYLFRRGDAADGFYFLEAGRVSVVVELPNGAILRHRTYMGGTILGEMGFYSQTPRSASVIAEQASRLHFLSSEAFEKLTANDPLLAACFNQGVVNLVAERLRRVEESMELLLR